MMSEKRFAVALLVVVVVALSYASETAQPATQGEYVESRQCEVPRLYTSSRLLLFTHSFFFRIAVSARTGSLPVSSSFRVTYFRTLHCLPLSEWVASQVNSRYVITLHFFKACMVNYFDVICCGMPALLPEHRF